MSLLDLLYALKEHESNRLIFYTSFTTIGKRAYGKNHFRVSDDLRDECI